MREQYSVVRRMVRSSCKRLGWNVLRLVMRLCLMLCHIQRSLEARYKGPVYFAPTKTARGRGKVGDRGLSLTVGFETTALIIVVQVGGGGGESVCLMSNKTFLA